MKEFVKYLVLFCLIIFIVALDTSFFPALGGIWGYMNICLSLSLFLIIIVDKSAAFIIFLLSTFIAGVTSSSLIIIPMLVGGITLILVNWFFESFFTNRTYYTLLALGYIGWFVYYFLFSSMLLVFNLVGSTALLPQLTKNWIWGIFMASILLAPLLTIGYTCTTYFNERIRSYFVVTG